METSAIVTYLPAGSLQGKAQDAHQHLEKHLPQVR